ncbi:hypothetical protein MKS88_004031 [Plasmodium brasilianum]|uniref:Uncharacterized protein n=1 Tax=Plasmodium brasilianum TaxID=5824 RepID=A0ACB9Y634_PLABR|nr:hypothetical protein MKS88_004031 [Plasmodium brasilianum]
MEIKIIILLLVNIFAFNFLPWRSYFFDNDMSLFNNSLNEMYSFRRKLGKRVCRLLSRYKQDMYSNILGIKDDLPYNGENNKESVYSNENDKKVRTKSTKGSSLNKAGNHKKNKNYNSCIFKTKKYSRFEKKIFKELDYEDFLKKNRTISDKLYKKIILKKYGLRLFLPLLLFSLLSLSLILDLFAGYGLLNLLYKVLSISGAQDWMKYLGPNFNKLIGNSWATFLKPFFTPAFGENEKLDVFYNLFGTVIYFLPFIIMGVTIISWIIFYHKKVKKYERIKFRKM